MREMGNSQDAPTVNLLGNRYPALWREISSPANLSCPLQMSVLADLQAFTEVVSCELS